MANDASTYGPQTPAYGVGDSVREPAYGALRLRKTAKSETALDLWPLVSLLNYFKFMKTIDRYDVTR